MEFINKIEEVNQFHVDSKFEILWVSDTIMVNGLKILTGKIDDFILIENLLFIRLNSGRNTKIYNLEIEEFTDLDYSGKILDSSIILVGRWNESYTERTSSAINWRNGDILWKTKRDFGKFFNLENEIIAAENNKIIKIDKQQFQPQWQFDLSQFGKYKNVINEECSYEVKQFINVFKNLIIVQLSNASFVFIDIDSGDLINKISLNEIGPLPNGVHYDDEITPHLFDNRIIWLNNQRLVHLNLDDCKLTIVKDYFTGSRENQFRFMNNIYHKGYIYFAADFGWQYITPSRIGVMSAVNGDVIWQKQLKETGGINSTPQIIDRRAYYRTTRGSLYVFENNIKDRNKNVNEAS